jgi:murein DD-endopeptidase MepM/ murein hydrolase activator NlpD
MNLSLLFVTIYLSILLLLIIVQNIVFAAVEPDLKATQRIRTLNTVVVTQTPALPLMRTTSDGASFQPPFPQDDPNFVGQWYSISNTFQPRWKISVNAYDFHRGIDLWNETIAAVPIVSIGTGVLHQVINSTSSGGGRTIMIEHTLPTAISSGPTKFHGRDIVRVFSVYNHLDSIDTTILNAAIGSSVAKGQLLGRMGQTGDTSFTHLHFETRLVGYLLLSPVSSHCRKSCFANIKMLHRFRSSRSSVFVYSCEYLWTKIHRANSASQLFLRLRSSLQHNERSSRLRSNRHKLWHCRDESSRGHERFNDRAARRFASHQRVLEFDSWCFPIYKH